MVLLTILIVSAFSVYIACIKSPWFWAVFVGATILLELFAKLNGLSPDTLPAGPFQIRATDPALLGVIVGTFYHMRRHGTFFLAKKPMGGIMGAILIFISLKTIFSFLLADDQIVNTRHANQLAGGLVAVIGDVRDNLLFLIPPFYVYAARRSHNLDRLGPPIFAATCLVIVKALIIISTTGVVWTGTAQTEDRFIHSGDAMNLVMFSCLLPFLPIKNVSARGARWLTATALIIAVVANHRSVWLAELAGLFVLTAAVMLGRPVFGRVRLARIALAGSAFFITSAIFILTSMDGLTRRMPLLNTLTVRLYAFTDPTKDPDSLWRETIWRDRIAQVGDNWPWGRPFGVRFETLSHGKWLNLPDHSAYVEIYELGGYILCVLVLLFWCRVIQISLRQFLIDKSSQRLWPPIVVLAITASSLTFGVAYPFPNLGPALVVAIVLGMTPQKRMLIRKNDVTFDE